VEEGRSAGNYFRHQIKLCFMELDFDDRKHVEEYVTGFCDAECCFSVAIKQNSTSKLGWRLDSLFQVTQHQENEEILHLIRDTIGTGEVRSKPGNNDLSIILIRNRQKLIDHVIPFFERNKLITKSDDFQKFKEIVERLDSGKHLDQKGLIDTIKLAYQMNLDGKQRRRDIDDIIDSIRRK
jgi:hypothetical protein